jgi:serine/threonine protein kinase
VQALPAGGFGQTYIAEDVKRPGNPQCVVKQLRPLTNDPTTLQIARRLFQTEAETLEKLGHHDRIPQLFAYFEDNQDFYLVQEFIPGQTLAQIMGQPLPEARVINLLTEVLEILVFVHSQNVIHRDIKPENLILRQTDNKIVLIDFGAVKELANQTVYPQGQTNRTVTVGTIAYMPVEQLHGNPQLNSDIYTLGMVAIQGLTGLLAHELSQLKDPNNPSTGEIIWSHRVPDLNPKLIDILNKMVRFDCRQRYQSASEILNDLNNLHKKHLHWQSDTFWVKGVAAAIAFCSMGLAIYTLFLQKLITPPQISQSQVLTTVKQKANRGDFQESIAPIIPTENSNTFNYQEAQKITPGEIVNAKIGEGDAVLPNNKQYKIYTLQGQQNDEIWIEMTSQEIDPSLILLDADGDEIARNEDISTSDFNSRINTRLPKDGVYIVLAISSQVKQLGSYSLKVGK